MNTEKGRARPDLDDVDLSDMPEPLRQPSPEEVERRRVFGSSLETPAFLERSSNAGMVKVVRPSSHFVSAKAADNRSVPPDRSQTESVDDLVRPAIPTLGQGRRPRAEEPNLTVRLPEYVQQAVRMRAVAEKTTVRLVILRALRGVGFEIDDRDMTDDRGIVAKMRTRQRTG